MLTCPQCKRQNCRKLHTLLLVAPNGLNAWSVEACGICHRAIKRQQEHQAQRRREAQT